MGYPWCASSKIAIASARDPATGLSMNIGLYALRRRAALLEVRPAVHTLSKKHNVNAREQRVDRVDDLDPKLLS